MALPFSLPGTRTIANLGISQLHASKNMDTSTTITANIGSSETGNIASTSGTVESALNPRKPKANRRRRRSIMTFFLPPSSLTGDATSSAQNCADTYSTLPLPPDVILTIGSLVPSSTLLNLILASSTFYTILLPSLYRTLVLSSSYHCLTLLPRLNRLNRPKRLDGLVRTGKTLCSYIHELILKPNYYLAWPRKDKFIDENWVTDMVEKLAKKGWLANLESFEWEGLEAPQDRMWEALRLGCPRLKNIMTNVGSRLIIPESKLFDFSNLTSFSIIVRHNLDGTESDSTYPHALTPLPPKFWDMINTRCSQTLSELSICSFSPARVAFDLGPLFNSIYATGATATRFPKLTSLSLGVFGYQSDYTVPTAPCLLLGEFLANHPSLTYLRVLWNFKKWLSPSDLSFFPPSFSTMSLTQTRTILPKMDTFVGVYQQLASIPLDIRKCIHTVDLTCEPLYEQRAQSALEVLKTVQGLKVLDIWVHLPSQSSTVSEGAVGGQDEKRTEQFFANLVDACMGLEEIHFMCTTPLSTKLLDLFLHHLSGLRSLRKFALTKGHVYHYRNTSDKTDESMFDMAVRVIRACKGVKTVSVRYARENCLNHLKKEGVYDVIERDADRGCTTLAANERGISWIKMAYEKRYRQRVVI